MNTENQNLVVINFKKLHGQAAADLVNKLSEEAHDSFPGYQIVFAMQTQDALRLKGNEGYKIFIQDIYAEDNYCFLNYFKHRPAGDGMNISGVILNHPEKKLSDEDISDSMEIARRFGLETVICAGNIEDGIRLNSYGPHYIAIENEAFLGKDTSIIGECPEIVGQAKTEINNKILFGAGIKTSGDLRHILNGGGSGVLISSLILKAEQPLMTLKNFLKIS